MATLNVFADKGSFFSKKSITVVEKLQPESCYYYFYNGASENFLKNQLSHTDLMLKFEANEIHKVIFHSLHDYQLKWARQLKKQYPHINISWVFWSYEFYQLSFNLKHLYGKYTQKYFWRKRISNAVARLKYWRNGQLETPFGLSEKAYRDALSIVDDFYSLVPEDGEEVFGQHASTVRHSFSYLPFSDIAVQLKSVEKKEVIMVGHNGNPLVNHQDALEILTLQKEPSPILIPLSYGKPRYIQDLKKVAATSVLNIEFLEQYMPLEEYYTLLSGVRAYIQPTRCQQGLGNILFFMYAGSAVYLCKESSTYRFFKSMNLVVFSMEELAEIGVRDLTENEKHVNHAFIESYINDARFERQWLELIQ